MSTEPLRSGVKYPFTEPAAFALLKSNFCYHARVCKAVGKNASKLKFHINACESPCTPAQNSDDARRICWMHLSVAYDGWNRHMLCRLTQIKIMTEGAKRHKHTRASNDKEKSIFSVVIVFYEARVPRTYITCCKLADLSNLSFPFYYWRP